MKPELRTDIINYISIKESEKKKSISIFFN